MRNLQGGDLNVWSEWNKCYHGTGSRLLKNTKDLLKSILQGSLLAAGDFKMDGTKLAVPQGHIATGKRVCGEDNWAGAIFTTPSLAYASKRVYAKHVDLPDWKQKLQVVFQVLSNRSHCQLFTKSKLPPPTIRLTISQLTHCQSGSPKAGFRHLSANHRRF